MHKSFTILLILLVSVGGNRVTYGADKVTYVTDVLPILRNSCLNCHNPDKHKAGLDLSTYQALMQGSDSNKVVEPGNPGNSLMLKLISHTDEPAMPPKSDKLPDSQINLIRKWIEGYALETTDSKAASMAKNNAPALEMFAEEKPSGPPPMPCDLLLEPVIRTSRPGAVVSLAASPRASLLAVAGQKQIVLYNTATLELAGVLPFPEGFPEVVRFSRDGRLLIAGGGIGAKSGRVVVWDVVSGKRVLEAGDEFDEVLATDISPDHHFIALGGPNRMVKIFQDGKLLFSIKKHTDWVTALAFTSDGKYLVSGDRQGGMYVWETATGDQIFMLPSHKAGVTALAAPGPLACLSASEDGTVKLWDLREGKEVKSWDAHKGGTLSLAFAPDGRLVSCGRDKRVRLWDRDGNSLKEFDPLGDVALSAAICGDRVIASDWTGAIHVWNADGTQLAGLTSNPSTLAERLVDVNKRLADLLSRREKAAAFLAESEQAATKSSAEARAAAESTAEKEKQVRTGEEQLASLNKVSDYADASLQKLRTELSQLQAATVTLSADLEKVKTDADKTRQESAGENKPDTTSMDVEVPGEKEATAKANEALAANKDALQAAQPKLDEQTATVDKLHTDLASAKDALAKVREDYDEMSKSLPPKAAQAEAAMQKLLQARNGKEQIDRELTAANAELAKWNAATVNVSLYAARKELADRMADEAKAVEDAHEASAELDKARADLAAAQKALADAPQNIKAKEDAITQAHQAMDKANAAVGAAKETVAHKEALIPPATDFSANLAAESGKLPDDVTLKDAAAKAKETLDLLNKDLATSRQTAEAAEAEAKRAMENSTMADKALAQAKSDADAAPALITKLQSTVDEVTNRTASAREAAEKLVVEAHKPVVAAQSKVDDLAHKYETLSRANSPAALELSKK